MSSQDQSAVPVYAGGDAGLQVFMAEAVARVSPAATLREAASKLIAVEAGALVVGDADGVDGVFSERDVVRALAAGKDPDAVKVGDVASRELLWCSPDSTVDQAARIMMENYVRHVLIGAPGKLRGIVSARDLLGAYQS